MKRKRYTLDIKKNQSFTLNITSMTDMFTILLVFLLQTFASAEVQIDAVKDLRLPSSISDKNPVQGVKLSLTHDKLSLNSTLLAELKSNEFTNDTIDPNDTNFIKPLYTALEKINIENKDKAEKPGKILFLADQDIPYSVLRKVMYTASMAGFPNLKLVTVAGN
jgi:biopolymer transport protein ExbD